jgi:hypothetical protein
MSSELRVGDSGNLLFGYRPWNHTDPVGRPFFAPQEAATVPVDPDPVAGDNKWRGLHITVHPDAASLVSKLYGYEVALGMGARGEVPAGPLVLQDADAKVASETLGKHLGVSLDPKYGYMLARIVRKTSTVEHPLMTQGGNPGLYLTGEGRDALASLPGAGTRASIENAQAHLKFFYRFGTHFVSRIVRGDVIYQVFTYNRSTFQEKVAKRFAELAGGAQEISGQDAWEMRDYTTPRTGGSQGPVMVAQYGHISAVSRDPELDKSIQDKKWADDEYAKTNQSIFAAYLSGGPTLKNLKKTVPITVTMTGMEALCHDPRVAAATARMMQGGLLQKYSPGVQISLTRPSQQWQQVYPTAGAWLSTLATPTVDVYQERLDLPSIQVGKPAGVKSFTATAHVMQASGTTQLPGTEKVRLISHIIDTSNETTLPVLRVSPSASVEIHAGRMSGGLAVESEPTAPKRQVLLDGLRFTSPATPDKTTARYLVTVESTVRTRPPEKLVTSLTNSAQCALVAGESLLHSRSEHAARAHALGREFLEWLAGIIPAETQSRELLAVRSRALYLARASSGLQSPAVSVPYFRYDSYKGLVEALLKSAENLKGDVKDLKNKLEARRREELAARSQEEINKNIKATGELLKGYLGSLKEHEEALGQQHRQIIEQKRSDYTNAGLDVLKLQAAVEQQVAEVSNEVNLLHNKIAKKEELKWVAFSIDIAKLVFSAVGDIKDAGKDAPGAVKKMSQTAKNLKRLKEVLKALGEISGKLHGQLKDVKKVHERMKNLQSDLRLPTPAEWEEFKTNFSNSLEPLEGHQDLRYHRANLTAAFAILVLRGKAWVEAQAHLHQLQMELDAAHLKKSLGDQQQKRLEGLFKKLHLSDESKAPELDGVDLIGLTSEAELRLKHALTALGQSLLTQDSALQYEYLGQPQPIRSFTLDALLEVMAQQQKNILKGIQNLQPLPQKVKDPITYTVKEVPHASLYKKEWEFEIPLDAHQFGEYTVVRIDKVIARIKGIKNGQGSYVIALTYQGSPFHDRDKARSFYTFDTVPRLLGPYKYDRNTGKLTFGDQPGPLADKITRVTPFSTWKISLPDDPANKDLQFDKSTVDIELDFCIEAQRPTRTFTDLDVLTLGDDLETGTVAPLISEEDLVARAFGAQSVLNDWDAVLCMDRDEVNNILAKLYAEQKHPGGEMDLNFSGWTGHKYEHNDEWYGQAVKVTLKLTKPEVDFGTGQSVNAIFTQNVKSGSVTTGSKKVSEDWDWKTAKFDEKEITWSKKSTSITPEKKAKIKGTVPFEILNGKVKTNGGTKAVVLAVHKGQFRAENLDLENLEGVNAAIKNAYYRKNIEYHINTIDLTKISTYDSLKPTAFKVTAVEASGGKSTLSVFITTDGKTGLNPVMAITEPLPGNYNCALYINTRVLFSDIVGKGFKAPGLRTEAAPPTKKEDLAWRTKICGTLSGDINWPKKWNWNSEVEYAFRFSKDNEKTVNITLSDFHFQRQNKGNLVAELKMEKYQLDFVHFGCHWQHGCDPEHLWKKAKLWVTLTATSVFPVTVTDPPDQKIKIGNSTATPSVSITGLGSENACARAEADVKAHLAQELRTLLPKKIKEAVEKITFSEASVFALQNLLFPADKHFVLKKAYVPGDLLILGNLDSKA